MEEKVEQLEARSAAVAELATDSLEQKFALLESGSGSGIDDELALLKAKILPSSGQPQGSLTTGSSSRDVNTAAVDQDLEDLKRSIDQI